MLLATIVILVYAKGINHQKYAQDEYCEQKIK
jgi:hypothetical protein